MSNPLSPAQAPAPWRRSALDSDVRQRSGSESRSRKKSEKEEETEEIKEQGDNNKHMDANTSSNSKNNNNNNNPSSISNDNSTHVVTTPTQLPKSSKSAFIKGVAPNRPINDSNATKDAQELNTTTTTTTTEKDKHNTTQIKVTTNPSTSTTTQTTTQPASLSKPPPLLSKPTGFSVATPNHSTQTSNTPLLSRAFSPPSSRPLPLSNPRNFTSPIRNPATTTPTTATATAIATTPTTTTTTTTTTTPIQSTDNANTTTTTVIPPVETPSVTKPIEETIEPGSTMGLPWMDLHQPAPPITTQVSKTLPPSASVTSPRSIPTGNTIKNLTAMFSSPNSSNNNNNNNNNNNTTTTNNNNNNNTTPKPKALPNRAARKSKRKSRRSTAEQQPLAIFAPPKTSGNYLTAKLTAKSLPSETNSTTTNNSKNNNNNNSNANSNSHSTNAPVVNVLPPTRQEVLDMQQMFFNRQIVEDIQLKRGPVWKKRLARGEVPAVHETTTNKNDSNNNKNNNNNNKNNPQSSKGGVTVDSTNRSKPVLPPRSDTTDRKQQQQQHQTTKNNNNNITATLTQSAQAKTLNNAQQRKIKQQKQQLPKLIVQKMKDSERVVLESGSPKGNVVLGKPFGFDHKTPLILETKWRIDDLPKGQTFHRQRVGSKRVSANHFFCPTEFMGSPPANPHRLFNQAIHHQLATQPYDVAISLGKVLFPRPSTLSLPSSLAENQHKSMLLTEFAGKKKREAPKSELSSSRLTQPTTQPTQPISIHTTSPSQTPPSTPESANNSYNNSNININTNDTNNSNGNVINPITNTSPISSPPQSSPSISLTSVSPTSGTELGDPGGDQEDEEIEGEENENENEEEENEEDENENTEGEDDGDSDSEEEDTKGLVFYHGKTDTASLKGGTLDRLIERLTYEKYPDPEFVLAFLLTYRSFTKSDILLNKLIARYHISPPEGLTEAKLEQWKRKKEIYIKLRVINVVKIWLEKHFDDFLRDKQLVSTLLDFVDNTLSLSGMDKVAGHLKTVLNKKLSNVENTLDYVEGGAKEKPKAEDVNINSLASPDISYFQNLDFDEVEFARQLTLIEHEAFRLILPQECFNQAWLKNKPNAKNICAMIRRSNQVPFFLASLIVTKETPRARAQMLKKIISVGDHCRLLNNFNGVMEILSGLNLTPIYCLRKTWALLPRKSVAIYQSLSNLMAPAGNFKNYREVLRSGDPPCVPYLGRYLTDLVFIEDGHPDMLPVSDGEGMINFVKRKQLSAVIREIQQYQSIQYNNIKSVPEIREMLLNAQSLSENELYKLSRIAEPRDSGR